MLFPTYDYFNLYSPVPAPVLTISGNPRNNSFSQGLDLALTCNVTLAETVDTPVTIQGMWFRNGTELMSGDENGRITISNVIVESSPYEITLRFNPIRTSDAGTYKCDMTVIPH